MIGNDDAIADDVNDFEIAVGRVPVAYANGFPVERAAMWNVSGATITVINLGDPTGGFESAAMAINNAGTVVGYKYGFTGAFHIARGPLQSCSGSERERSGCRIQPRCGPARVHVDADGWHAGDRHARWPKLCSRGE